MKNPKHMKNMALNITKTPLFTMWELKQEGRASPCWTLAGNMHSGQFKFFTTLCMSVKDQESTTSIDLGITNKF